MKKDDKNTHLVRTEDGKFRKLKVIATGRTLLEEIIMRSCSQFLGFVAGSLFVYILLKYLELR